MHLCSKFSYFSIFFSPALPIFFFINIFLLISAASLIAVAVISSVGSLNHPHPVLSACSLPARLFAHWPSPSVVVVVAALELKAVLLNSSGKLVSFTGNSSCLTRRSNGCHASQTLPSPGPNAFRNVHLWVSYFTVGTSSASTVHLDTERHREAHAFPP